MLVGLAGNTVPGGVTTGANGLRVKAGRSAPGAGGPGGPAGTLIVGLAFGIMFAPAGVPAGTAAAISAPSPSDSGAACGCALLEALVAAAMPSAGVRLLPRLTTAGEAPPGSPAAKKT